jgi:hypothetical protein
MRIAAIACASFVALAGTSALAECNWSIAKAGKADDVIASATTSTPAPAQSTPVRLPETEEQS